MKLVVIPSRHVLSWKTLIATLSDLQVKTNSIKAKYLCVGWQERASSASMPKANVTLR